MESPFFNLAVFAAITVLAAALLWPRVGLIQALRTRMRMTKRTRLEDALKYAHECESNDRPVTNSSLAKALQISPAKTAELAAHMTRTGLIFLRDSRILLTKEGKQYALQIIRAHRLWERYLADETGTEPQEWHTQAEEHEHLLSPEETDALSDRLGNPRFDPHGDPIPTADGELLQEKLMTLTQLGVGERAIVRHLEDEPEEVYGQLVALGVRLGMELRLKDKSGGNYIVETGGHEIKLTREAALNISIEPVTVLKGGTNGDSPESLADLQDGEKATVMHISPACRGFERRRLMDLGILPGTSIKFYRNGLTGGLTAFHVRGTVLALRSEQTQMISICDRKQDEE